MATIVDDERPGKLGPQAVLEAIENTNTDTIGWSQQNGRQVCLNAQPAVAVTGPTDQSTTPTEDIATTASDVLDLNREEYNGKNRDEQYVSDKSSLKEARTDLSAKTRALAIGSPEKFRGSRNGTVRPPISQEPLISALRALGEIKSLQDRAGCTERTPTNYSSGETAILLDQGVKITRISTKAALAVLLIAQCMTSGCLYFRVVLMV